MTDTMSAIASWRRDHKGQELDETVLREILGVTTLRNANLRYADIRHADLRHAYLGGVNFQEANLRGVDLYGADLRGADLRRADLRGANLEYAHFDEADLHSAFLTNANMSYTTWMGANLCHVEGGVMQLNGLYPYQATLIPTPTSRGWTLRIGCWHGTVNGLRKLAAQNDGWPEAEGDEITHRRPLLYAIADLCDVHIANHPGLIDRLRERWNED